MIVHEAVAEDVQPRLAGIVAEGLHVEVPVLFSEEDVLVVVPTLGDMVWDAGDGDSREAWHIERLPFFLLACK